MNYAPSDLDPEKDLPKGFFEFLLPLHKQFTPWQQKLAEKRGEVLEKSHGPRQKQRLPVGESRCRIGARISATK